MPSHPLLPVACVTGAAGGLGQGLVVEFERQGWRVLAGWHRHRPESVSERIWAVPLDVTRPETIERAVSRVVERWGRIDAFVNNAGLTADAAFWQMKDADWDRAMKVNLTGAFACCRAVLPVMIRQRQGQIIQIASSVARVGARGQANYAAAKAGLIGLTQSLAREVGADNVCVNAVLPGVLPTPMTAALTRSRRDELAAANALERSNTIEEVARFVAFLATTRNISGQMFQLDSRPSRWA